VPGFAVGRVARDLADLRHRSECTCRTPPADSPAMT